MQLLPLELPAAPTGLRAVDGGVVVAFADHQPMFVREQFGTLLGFVIGHSQDEEDEE